MIALTSPTGRAFLDILTEIVSIRCLAGLIKSFGCCERVAQSPSAITI